MNKKGGIWACMRLILLPVALLTCLVLTQTPVHGAIVNCATAGDTDYDGDGFTDKQECEGIYFAGPQPPEPRIEGSFSGPNLPRALRLDPDTEDLFVILVPAVSGSKIPTNPLEFVSKTVASGGLGITVHLITEAHVSDLINRFVSQSSYQRAVHIRESLDEGSTVEQKNTLGACDQGMVLDDCIVWTKRIENKIAAICGPNWGTDTTCKDRATNMYGQNLLYRYIKHTIAHELGHSVNLKVDPSNNHHSNPSTSNPKEMDSSVAVSKKTFSIGTVFTSADQGGFIQE